MGKVSKRSSSSGGDDEADGKATVVGGFTAVRVRLDKLPFSRVLYTKLHRSRKGDTTLPMDRTVFIANAQEGEASLRAVFGRFGEVEAVHMAGGGDKHEAGDQAHVVFSTAKACKKCLSSPGEVNLDEEDRAAAGGCMRGWVDEQRSRRVSPAELQLSVDAYMSHFDERTEEEKRRQANTQVDEDGFELVTYKRKARDLGSDNKVEAPVKKKKKELVDFYRFQVRDKRREELASLRKRFDNDKVRVAEMKKQRKFKPF